MMKNIYYTTLISLCLTLFMGCMSKNPYNGFYNALFYDYDKRLSQLDENFSLEKSENRVLEQKYQNREKEVAFQERNFLDQVESLELIEESIREMNTVLNGLDSHRVSGDKLIKIKELVLHMKSKINSKKVLKKDKRQERIIPLHVQREEVNKNLDQTLYEIDTQKRDRIVKAVIELIQESKKYRNCLNCKVDID